VVRSSISVSFGSTLGATADFQVGCHATRDDVERRLAAFPRYSAIDRAVADQGWHNVGLTGLHPAFPFGHFSDAFGMMPGKVL
jgi:uncharacterized membrane protein YdjX (TVP38/TMEM64 family)